MTRKLLLIVAAAIIGLGSLAGTGGPIGSASAQDAPKKSANKGGNTGGNKGANKGPSGNSGSGNRRGGNAGRNVGIAAAVIAGTIIAAGAASANRGSRGEGLSCRALDRRCDDGQNWACRRMQERDC